MVGLLFGNFFVTFNFAYRYSNRCVTLMTYFVVISTNNIVSNIVITLKDPIEDILLEYGVSGLCDKIERKIGAKRVIILNWKLIHRKVG